MTVGLLVAGVAGEPAAVYSLLLLEDFAYGPEGAEGGDAE